MRKISFAIMAGIAALTVSSCGTGLHLSNAVNQFGAQTVVNLSQANFRIVRNVEAVIEVNNSNLRRIDVEKSAYAQLLRNANLHGSQALINVVIEEVRRTKPTLLCGPKHKQYVAARATIIEFIDGPAIAPNSSVSQSVNMPEESVVVVSKSSDQTIPEDKMASSEESKDVTYTLSNRAGTYKANIDADVIYAGSSDKWIKVKYLGRKDGMSSIEYSVEYNESFSSRTGRITLTTKDGNIITVNIIQR